RDCGLILHDLRSLYKQQTGRPNFFPGGGIEEGFELFGGTRKGGFYVPEQRVSIRRGGVRRRWSNQIVKHLSLLLSKCRDVPAGPPKKDEARPSSRSFTG